MSDSKISNLTALGSLETNDVLPIVDTSSSTTKKVTVSTLLGIINEVVSGSGTSWVLANTPISSTLKVYANGQRLTPTVDYSISGTTITTVNTWAAGTLLADYNY